MAIIYYKDDMELKVVAAPYRGPANDTYICRDLRSATGARYVLIAIHDRECEKKLLTVLAQGKNPSSFSFARNDEMIYGFPYREPRRFTAFASHQALTGFQREQTALTLVMACIASELPSPLLYLLLTQDGISITKENEIFFTPPYDLSQLDTEADETACTVRCAELVRELLSPTPETPVFLPRQPLPERKRRFFRRRAKAPETEAQPEEIPVRTEKPDRQARAERKAEKRRQKREKKNRKKLLQSCELIEKKCRSRSYSSLAELYRDIQLTALPEKKPTFGQRIKGFWVRNRDRIFHILLVLCTIAVIIAVIMLISQLIFGDVPLLRLFRHCFYQIGTESLNLK